MSNASVILTAINSPCGRAHEKTLPMTSHRKGLWRGGRGTEFPPRLQSPPPTGGGPIMKSTELLTEHASDRPAEEVGDRRRRVGEGRGLRHHDVGEDHNPVRPVHHDRDAVVEVGDQILHGEP